jgi:hypothetical protein
MRHSQIRLAILQNFQSQADFAMAIGADESKVVESFADVGSFLSKRRRSGLTF